MFCVDNVHRVDAFIAFAAYKRKSGKKGKAKTNGLMTNDRLQAKVEAEVKVEQPDNQYTNIPMTAIRRL